VRFITIIVAALLVMAVTLLFFQLSEVCPTWYDSPEETSCVANPKARSILPAARSTSLTEARRIEVALAAHSWDLRVRVLSPNGSPISDASFALFCTGETGVIRIEICVSAEPNGIFRLEATESGDGRTEVCPARSKMQLDVCCKQFGKVSAEILRGESMVEVRYAEGAADVGSCDLTVHILALSHSTESRVNVALLPLDEDPIGRRNWVEKEAPEKTPDVGPVLFVGLGCRKYTVLLLDQGCVIASTIVDTHRGENHAELSMPPLFTVSVFVPDGREKDEVFLFLGPNPVSRAGELSASLLASLDRLPAGDYVVAHVPITGKGGGYERMRVAEDAVVTLRPTPIDSLMVRVTNSDGVFAGAGFEDGDVITRINGESFRDHASPHHAIDGLAHGIDAIMYTVQRGSVMSEIYVGARGVRDAVNWGASLQPVFEY